MAQTIKKTKVVGNPGRRAFGSQVSRKRPSGAGHRRAPNPGQIIGFTLGNPGRKVSMAKTKKKSHKSHMAGGYSVSKYKHNPGHKQHHKRHNPGMLSGVGPLVTNALFVIVGALGSKLGAQVVLGSNNVGAVGYAGNAAAGGVLWFLAEKVMKNRNAASGIIAGTAVQIILRLINDYTPFGQYVSQLGMGDYQMQSFVTPQVLVDPWHSAEIAAPASPGGVIPANTPMPNIRPAPGAPGATAAGAPGLGGGLYGGGPGVWGGGLYAT